MPPKKKGKKTKAETEADKIAEAAAAEAKLVEDAKNAEEAVLLAEQEAKRIEELRKSSRVDELDRLKQSLEDMSEEIALRHTKQESKKKQEEDGREWDQFLACSSQPRINDGDLNTYITETVESNMTTLNAACECFVATEAIIEDVSKQLIRTRGEASFRKVAANRIEDFIPQLRNMCLEKLDNVTANILQHSDNYFINEEKEIRIAEGVDGLKVSLFGSLSLSLSLSLSTTPTPNK
tara:strand:- start:451 stop:1161 length:711 start_codon:yes stop_codon:yes gene_type:complete